MDDMTMLQQTLANNPQFAAQLFQMMQQNGMIPQNQGGGGMNQRPPMNWNMPTNPMAAMWYNFMNQMNNQNNQNNQQAAQNQSQPQQQQQVAADQQTNNKISLVRVIKSTDDIKPNEIPSDGSISLFLMDDLGAIYGKCWTNNGTVKNLRFVLERDDPNRSDPKIESSKTSMNQDEIFERLSRMMSEMIDEKLSKFNSQNKNASAKSGNKKGVEENGV